MKFDPFGDSKKRGYLRNIHGLPAGKRLKDLEHQDFETFLPDALAFLNGLKSPGYHDLLTVHRKLFGGLYPWAGQDRFELFPGSIVSKGRTNFALSNNIQKAFEIGMHDHNTPGQMLGHLAYAHPFLEGNGRALFVFFDDHLRRQGLTLNWPGLDRDIFLKSLDEQISRPDSASLDMVLEQHLSKFKKEKSPSTLQNVVWRPKKKP